MLRLVEIGKGVSDWAGVPRGLGAVRAADAYNIAADCLDHPANAPAILAAGPSGVQVSTFGELDDWSARFACIGRGYRYRIMNRPARPAIEADRLWHVKRRLDAAAMHEAAQGLLGRHDFSAYRAAACQAKSALRTLDRLDVSRRADEIHIEASARSFLHHQIRSFAGTLKLVGEGKWQPRDVKAALEARDRSACGPVAPPDGLYLTRVDY